MATIVFSKKHPRQISPHFHSSEFDCNCGTCVTTLVDSDLIERLEQLRNTVGYPVRVTSGYRCQYYQAQLKARGYETAAGTSTHELGRAADISVTGKDGRITGKELEILARQAGFTSVGVGMFFVHVDTRPGYRRWEYAY